MFLSNIPPPPPELPISRVDGSSHVRSCRSNGPLLFYIGLTGGATLILVQEDLLAFMFKLSFHFKNMGVKFSLICSFITALKITQQTLRLHA